MRYGAGLLSLPESGVSVRSDDTGRYRLGFETGAAQLQLEERPRMTRLPSASSPPTATPITTRWLPSGAVFSRRSGASSSKC